MTAEQRAARAALLISQSLGHRGINPGDDLRAKWAADILREITEAVSEERDLQEIAQRTGVPLTNLRAAVAIHERMEAAFPPAPTAAAPETR